MLHLTMEFTRNECKQLESVFPKISIFTFLNSISFNRNLLYLPYLRMQSMLITHLDRFVMNGILDKMLFSFSFDFLSFTFSSTVFVLFVVDFFVCRGPVNMNNLPCCPVCPYYLFGLHFLKFVSVTFWFIWRRCTRTAHPLFCQPQKPSTSACDLCNWNLP